MRIFHIFITVVLVITSCTTGNVINSNLASIVCSNGSTASSLAGCSNPSGSAGTSDSLTIINKMRHDTQYQNLTGIATNGNTVNAFSGIGLEISVNAANSVTNGATIGLIGGWVDNGAINSFSPLADVTNYLPYNSNPTSTSPTICFTQSGGTSCSGSAYNYIASSNFQPVGTQTASILAGNRYTTSGTATGMMHGVSPYANISAYSVFTAISTTSGAAVAGNGDNQGNANLLDFAFIPEAITSLMTNNVGLATFAYGDNIVIGGNELNIALRAPSNGGQQNFNVSSGTNITSFVAASNSQFYSYAMDLLTTSNIVNTYTGANQAISNSLKSSVQSYTNAGNGFVMGSGGSNSGATLNTAFYNSSTNSNLNAYTTSGTTATAVDASSLVEFNGYYVNGFQSRNGLSNSTSDTTGILNGATPVGTNVKVNGMTNAPQVGTVYSGTIPTYINPYFSLAGAIGYNLDGYSKYNLGTQYQSNFVMAVPVTLTGSSEQSGNNYIPSQGMYSIAAHSFNAGALANFSLAVPTDINQKYYTCSGTGSVSGATAGDCSQGSTLMLSSGAIYGTYGYAPTYTNGATTNGANILTSAPGSTPSSNASALLTGILSNLKTYNNWSFSTVLQYAELNAIPLYGQTNSNTNLGNNAAITVNGYSISGVPQTIVIDGFADVTAFNPTLSSSSTFTNIGAMISGYQATDIIIASNNTLANNPEIYAMNNYYLGEQIGSKYVEYIGRRPAPIYNASGTATGNTQADVNGNHVYEFYYCLGASSPTSPTVSTMFSATDAHFGTDISSTYGASNCHRIASNDYGLGLINVANAYNTSTNIIINSNSASVPLINTGLTLGSAFGDSITNTSSAGYAALSSVNSEINCSTTTTDITSNVVAPTVSSANYFGSVSSMLGSMGSSGIYKTYNLGFASISGMISGTQSAAFLSSGVSQNDMRSTFAVSETYINSRFGAMVMPAMNLNSSYRYTNAFGLMQDDGTISATNGLSNLSGATSVHGFDISAIYNNYAFVLGQNSSILSDGNASVYLQTAGASHTLNPFLSMVSNANNTNAITVGKNLSNGFKLETSFVTGSNNGVTGSLLGLSSIPTARTTYSQNTLTSTTISFSSIDKSVAGFSLGQMDESSSFLGSMSSGALAITGSQTNFARFQGAVNLTGHHFLAGSFSEGISNPGVSPTSLFQGFSTIQSQAFTAGYIHDNFMGGKLFVTYAEPLRVIGGNANLNGTNISLIPTGVEKDYEVSFAKSGISKYFSAGLIYKHNVNNISAAPDVIGGLVRVNVRI